MKRTRKLALMAAVSGIGVLYLQLAVAWWGGDRWRDRDWWDRPGYWGGYPGYGGWGYPGFGGWGYPRYGGWGYPGYGGWGYPGYGWGGYAPNTGTTTSSTPEPPPAPQ
jgi:hypothetical protein